MQQGISGLARNSFASFLCVGGSLHFLIAIIFPIVMFYSGQADMPRTRTASASATLAGVAGGGALFVIFANRAVPRGWTIACTSRR
ncbi:MAG: hypothetical protein U0793_21420 [Gemmataceae bacterium]